MNVVNDDNRPQDAAKISALQAHMAALFTADFDDIRASILLFAGDDDGTIHQVAVDAGYIVEP